jgi:hypothetical protein
MVVKVADMLIKALDAGTVALSAERAGLYQDADGDKPRAVVVITDDTGRGKRAIPCFEMHETTSHELRVTARGDVALRWLQTLANEDAAAQVERAAERRRAADAAAAAAALSPAAVDAVRAAAATSKPGETTVTVHLTAPSPGVAMAPELAGQLTDFDDEFIEAPTPPATPPAKRKRGK